MFLRLRSAICLAILTPGMLGLVPGVVPAQQPAPIDKRFSKSETMIAMRDGVKLYTTLFTPKDVKAPLPFILLRTPYGIEAGGAKALQNYMKELADEGYISSFRTFAGASNRRGRSFMSRMPRDKQDATAIDELYRYARHHRLAGEECARQ